MIGGPALVAREASRDDGGVGHESARGMAHLKMLRPCSLSTVTSDSYVRWPDYVENLDIESAS